MPFASKNKKEMKENVRIFIWERDIEKCVILVMNKGKIKATQGIEVDN